MGLEEVKEDISREIKSKARSIEDEGRAEAAETLKKAREQVEEMRKAADADVARTIEEIRKREMSGAVLQAKKMLLEAKKKTLDAAFEKTKSLVEKMPSKEREEILKNQVERAKREINAKFFYSNERDRPVAEKIAMFDFKFAGKIDTLGGITAESADKSFLSDMTFDAALEATRQKTLGELSKMLFAETEIQATKKTTLPPNTTQKPTPAKNPSPETTGKTPTTKTSGKKQ